MKNAEIRSDGGVTLVGGGRIGKSDLAEALHLAPVLVAADGGAAPALADGHELLAVVGDLDSLHPDDHARIPRERVFQITEQDSTDFDKALRSVSAPVVLAVGFLGGRLDHQFAALNVLVRYPEKPCILIGEAEVVLHLPRVLQLELKMNDVVSLYPMVPVRGRSRGLKWPIDGLELAPDGRIGTSNRALGAIRLETESDGLLAILPRRALPEIVRGLAAVPLPAPVSP
jgi:thiamine pyrophosphokinase